MVILNANVYTVDPQRPRAQAVAILNNRIHNVGTNAEIEKLITASTVVNANEKLVLPGFNDAHLHFIGGGRTLLEVNLQGISSLDNLAQILVHASEKLASDDWLTGRGWDHTLFLDGKWPTKGMLDSVIPDRPVFLRRVDGHVGWANSKALERARISKDTPNPWGGEILRDANGEPSGILTETAMNLIMDIIPEKSAANDSLALLQALEEAKHKGVTSIQDNSGIASIPLYHQLAMEEKLTVRVSEWLDFDMAMRPSELQKQIEHYSNFTIDHFIELGQLKGFVDGTLGSRTAYFDEPYADDSTTCGLPQYKESELLRRVVNADSMGLQIGLHCIGAKANHITLNAYEAAIKSNKSFDRRHRIEHAQVLRLEDISRFAEWGIIASMQPTHCTTDLRWAEKRLGRDRCRGAYAWKSLLNSGATVAFGTDWPVEPLDPMRGLYSAVTRQSIETGDPEGGWFPEETLSIQEAIYCYTMGSACAEFKEHQKGSISPGKLADIIILSQDLLNIPPRDILTTQVDMTIFNGNIIYTRPESGLDINRQP